MIRNSKRVEGSEDKLDVNLIKKLLSSFNKKLPELKNYIKFGLK
jgi:hypothetical protein